MKDWLRFARKILWAGLMLSSMVCLAMLATLMVAREMSMLVPGFAGAQPEAWRIPWWLLPASFPAVVGFMLWDLRRASRKDGGE